MRSDRVYRTEAVILKGYDYGEADRILTLYTANAGKLRAIAKGIRRTKSRMSGHLDLFMRSSLLVARGRQLDIVTQAETVENFRPMRADLWRLSYCHYVAELLENFSSENLASYPVYELAIKTFRRLATAPDLDLVARAFELELLNLTGYRPQLYRCLQCDSTIAPEANRFSSSLGGVLCPRCASSDAAAPPISVAALKLLRNLQRSEASVLQVTGLDRSLLAEVEQRLQEYIVYRLESQPRSLRFLERLRSESAGT